MLRIRESLPPFNYEPSPAPDNISRIKREMIVLENGAEYEGEWDLEGRKDGRGI